MFSAIGWCVAFPLALAAEALTVITALELYADGQYVTGLVWATMLVTFAAFVALFLGYTLRNAGRKTPF